MPKKLTPLFSPTSDPKRIPLAERLRPSTWESFQGIDGLPATLLNRIRRGEGRLPSLVLWGPPGSGKTTLARLIGSSYRCHFVEVSAVLVGVKEVREIIEEATTKDLPTLLFVDEIHRFNKAQQDAFLPHVEAGTVALIGATTENPSFYCTSALLSRVTVVVLPPLETESLRAIIRAGERELSLEIDREGEDLLLQLSGGDARKALNLLEGLRQGVIGTTVDASTVKKFLSDARNLIYDRGGEEHYNVASAFIKSLRGSDPDAALYWGFRMIAGGEDPRFVIRRMMIFASEDIGNADPRALELAVATAQAYERIGLPEGRIPIAHCITYLASAPKSNRSYLAMHRAIEAVERTPQATVPLHLRNAPTKLMKDLGYGAEYDYPHDRAEGYVPGVSYLPPEVKSGKFYEPSEHGLERKIREHLARLKQPSTTDFPSE